MADEDVTRKSGAYAYVLDGDERQDGRCAVCGLAFDLSDMHADHITPWSKGGHATPDNCQMLCRDCNLRKGVQSCSHQMSTVWAPSHAVRSDSL